MSLCQDATTASSFPLINDFLRSLNRGGRGSGFMPDNDGNTELMSPASFVKVEAARRRAEVRLAFIVQDTGQDTAHAFSELKRQKLNSWVPWCCVP